MHREPRDGLVVHRFDALPADRLDCLVSTRGGGRSVGPYASLNLGLRVEDDDATVVANRRLLFDAFDLPLARSVWCRQVHDDSVAVVGGRQAGNGSVSEDDVIVDTDALVTDVVDLPLCVTLADCVPVIVYDPRAHVVGLAHAGWGGTVRRIASRTVAVMAERFGSAPADLIAAIGPSISPDDYEVGGEVIERARDGYGADADRILLPGPEGKARFDLWEANALDLEQAGVVRERIEVARISTSTSLDEFYSHRVEGGPTGRFIAAVSLRPRS